VQKFFLLASLAASPEAFHAKHLVTLFLESYKVCRYAESFSEKIFENISSRQCRGEKSRKLGLARYSFQVVPPQFQVVHTFGGGHPSPSEVRGSLRSPFALRYYTGNSYFFARCGRTFRLLPESWFLPSPLTVKIDRPPGPPPPPADPGSP